MLYSRKKTNASLKIDNVNTIKKYLIKNFSKDTIEKVAKSNIDSKELFLNGLFKTLYSKSIFDIIYNWFRDKFKIIYHADQIQVTPIINIENKDKKYVSNVKLNEAAKQFGLTSEKIVYQANRENGTASPLSVVDSKGEEKIIPAEVFESFGTIRFLNIFPIVAKALYNGATLVVDELDASIHPMAIMNILTIFHNDEINKKGAQLIFNTHNPIFLNSSLLRRDEIKFVEKEENKSTHYSLSDFGISGENGVRNTDDYLENYFINKYGAIDDIDFSDIIMNIAGEDEKN